MIEVAEPAKNELRALSEAAVAHVRESGQRVESFRGIALWDTERDEVFTSLDAFRPAMQAVASLPHFADRFGESESTRQTLQFVYELLRNLGEPVFGEDAFETMWRAFSEEIDDPNWTWLGLANMRNMRTEEATLDLGDGVTVQARDFDALRARGFDDQYLAALSEDWGGFGATSHVMLVEHQLPKSPDTVVLTDSTAPLKAQRALGALRLLAVGDISIGRMWLTRAARFNAGLGGLSATGFSTPAFAMHEYVLDAEIAAEVPPLYNDLRTLEVHGYGAGPGNLDLALRAFMSTYDRWPSFPQFRLVETVTALEALLGTESEIAFRLAFRVAGLLADDDAQRAAFFREVKAYYDLRSRLVHGGTLKPKHQSLLADDEPLRGKVRRLLRAAVHLATTPGHSYGKQFFREDLDATLLDAAARTPLRQAMGLELPPGGVSPDRRGSA